MWEDSYLQPGAVIGSQLQSRAATKTKGSDQQTKAATISKEPSWAGISNHQLSRAATRIKGATISSQW